jgi:hypothetical protein
VLNVGGRVIACNHFMAGTLPSPNQCCSPCDDIIIQQIAGPTGPAGADGADGVDGINAFTLFTAAFTIPAELGTDTATVADTSWMNISQKVYAARADGTVHGFFEVTAIGGLTSVTLKNLEDTATSAYIENSAPGSILNIGSKLMPAGIQGPTGATTGAAAGDLKGTYPSPKIGIGNTLGSSLWGNGTDTVAVPAGTNGHMLAYDSTDAEGVKSFKALPLTGDTDLADNRVMRADGATGLPVPAQPSKVTITDNGAVRADGSGGNARGTDAVDLQVTRSGATQVASGINSSLGGGLNNTASGDASTIPGGSTNVAAAAWGSIGGGLSNSVSGSASYGTVAGGRLNVAETVESFVGGGANNTAGNGANDRAVVVGGENNDATGQESFIGGGDSNLASGQQSTVAGGDNNQATGVESFVGGGGSNDATGTNATVAGGQENVASANYSAIPGGLRAVANKYGQLAHAAGEFATAGDAQASELVARNATANATPVELFLDGSATRITVPTSKSWMFQIMLVARQDTGLDSIYKSEGVIRNNAGTTSVNAVTTTEIYDGIGLPPTPVVVDADDPNDALRITVTGVAATNVRWVAAIRLVEVSY